MPKLCSNSKSLGFAADRDLWDASETSLVLLFVRISVSWITAASSHSFLEDKFTHRAPARICADLTESAFGPTIRSLRSRSGRENSWRGVIMTATATLQRRLVRTREAAAYLSMSDWKLRRLIQEGTFPVVQDHE
jgi:hypothetical protein